MNITTGLPNFELMSMQELNELANNQQAPNSLRQLALNHLNRRERRFNRSGGWSPTNYIPGLN